MLVVVCYGVNTETSAGRRRLRRVAKVCESTGQRVQKPVFECEVSTMQLDVLERRPLATVDIEHDGLRLYRLSDGAGCGSYVARPSRSTHESEPIVPTAPTQRPTTLPQESEFIMFSWMIVEGTRTP